MDLSDLFSTERHEFRMGLRRGDAAAFFAPGPDHHAVLAERRRWFRDDPAAYMALLPAAHELVEEATSLLRECGVSVESPRDPREQLRALGESVETDLVLLTPNAAGDMCVVGGCVCFPTAWRLADKLGKPMW